MVDLYLASIIVFVVLAVAWIIKDWRNIERSFIVFLRRTKKGIKTIYKIADKSPRLWAVIGDFGIVVGFLGMIGATWFLAKQAYGIFIGEVTSSSLSLVLPVASSSASVGSFWVGVPFWNFIIAIASLIVIHEGFHGIQARVAGVKIKSVGAGLLVIIPGAFVEPDEKALQKKSLRSRLRVFAAGSAGNFILAGLSLLLVMGATPAFMDSGVEFRGYIGAEQFNETSFPAQDANLTGIILTVDGIRVHNVNEFVDQLSRKAPGDSVSIGTTEGNYEIELIESPIDDGKAFLGIGGLANTNTWKAKYAETFIPSLMGSIFGIFYWVAIINFGVGLINLLPLKPLDGGHMWEALSKKLFRNSSDIAVWSIGAFTFALIIFSFVGPHIFG